MKFFTFEGGEGSGKSTQAELLYQAMKASGIEVVLTREPGGTEAAEEIRQLILTSKNSFHPITELLIHNAARYEHVKSLLIPALQEKKYIICDRFVDSTMAYQGYGHKIGKKLPAILHNLLMESIAPDLTFILDIEPNQGLERTKIRNSSNNYEKLNLDFHRRVREGFLEIATLAKNRCLVLNASDTKEEIHYLIVENINLALGFDIKPII